MLEKELRVIAVKRSGQHGIINWLLAQKPLCGNTVFLNNETLGAPTPCMGAEEILLSSYEDTDISTEDEELRLQTEAKELFYVLVMRDPFNLFASRLVWPWGKVVSKHLNRDNIGTLVRLWKVHAREYLGYTDYLPNKLCVSFNDWFKSKRYRRQLAKRFGLEFSDTGLNIVTSHGAGSSFDGIEFDGKAQQMAVLRRYKKVESNPMYNAVFMEDEELMALSDAIFKLGY